jgi:hypothetical protein
VATPAAVVLAIGVAWMGYYNWRVTGDARVTPYRLYDATYTVAPHFVFQKAQAREFGNPQMREFHAVWERSLWERQQTLGGWAKEAAGKTVGIGGMLLQPVFVVLAIAGLARAMRRDRWLWVGIAALACLVAGMLPVTWNFLNHYGAPLLPWWMAVVVCALRRSRGAAGKMLRRVAVAGWVFAGAWTVVAQARVQATGWEQNREGILYALGTESPGKDLVVVRYLPGHIVHVEWVYNEADVDGAEVVFARELSERENAEMFEYFEGRKVWLMEVGGQGVRMNPYPGK